MTTATPPVDPAVRSLYERYPYPPLERDLDAFRDGRRMSPGSPRYFYHQYWPKRVFRDKLDVLIAGCGASEAAKHALEQPALDVTGIDISRPSLERTQAWVDRYGLENVTLHELPIERAGELGRQFDLVICSGVLHHMPDPDIGLRALRSVIKAGGAMHLGVYARYGRTGVYMLQEYCRLVGVPTTDEGLRDLIETMQELPADHPFGIFLGSANTYGDPAAVADALLHPIDRAYTVRELFDYLDRTGMSFIRWMHQAPYLPCCGNITDTPHHAALNALPPREQYAAMELFRGSMIFHGLMIAPDDRPSRDYTIDFDGDEWRRAVPARFEGALVVDEPLSAGMVAALRNRGHVDKDLKLELSPPEAALLRHVNGVHTIDAIIELAELELPRPAARELARDFFRKMSCYDQVIMHVVP